jgi:hypothetical protein
MGARASILFVQKEGGSRLYTSTDTQMCTSILTAYLLSITDRVLFQPSPRQQVMIHQAAVPPLACLRGPDSDGVMMERQ